MADVENDESQERATEILKLYTKTKQLVDELPSMEASTIYGFATFYLKLKSRLDNSLLTEVDQCIVDIQKVISDKGNLNLLNSGNHSIRVKLEQILNILFRLKESL